MNTKISRQTLMTLSGLATLILAGSAFGQDLTSGKSALGEKEDPTTVNVFTVKPAYTHLFKADAEQGSGNITVDRAEVRLGYALKTGEAQFGLGGLYEYSNYQFNRADDFEANRLGFNAHYKSMVNDNWGYFGYGGIEMAASTKADLSDGVMGTVAAGATYVWSPTLSLGFGAAFASGIEADNRVLPVLILQWQINEHWALRTLNGVTVTYDINADKKTIIDAGVNYQYREYALKSNGLVGGKGSVVETMVACEVGVTHQFCKEFAMRGFVGIVTGREYEFYNNNGNKTASPDVDSGAMAGISANFIF